jgi:hypothetical protein
MPFIDHSKFVGPSTEPNPQGFEPPIGTPHRHHQKEEDPHLHTQ